MDNNQAKLLRMEIGASSRLLFSSPNPNPNPTPLLILSFHLVENFSKASTTLISQTHIWLHFFQEL